MRLTREVQIGDRRISVKELTVAEVRRWLQEAEGELRSDIVDLFLFSDVTVPDLVRLSDLNREAMEQMTPSELQQVIDVAKELNPDFFALRARLAAAAARLPELAAKQSSAAPVLS